MLSTIAEALVPIFFVLGLGYMAGKRKLLDSTNVPGLTTFVMTFALPATLGISIATEPRKLILGHLSQIFVFATVMGGVFALAWIIQRGFFGEDNATSALQAYNYATPNISAAGLPLLQNIYGQGSVVTVAIAVMTGNLLLSTTVLVLLENATGELTKGPPLRGIATALGRSLRKPVCWAPLAGLAYALSPLPVPDVAKLSLDLIGSATGGAALFLTGLVLSAQKVNLNANVALGSMVKDILQPLAAAGLVWLVGLRSTEAAESVMLFALPPAFASVVFGASYGVRPRVAGSTVVVASLVSIATLAATIWLLAPT